MLGNSQDAEDAAQEAFLRAFRYLHRYDAKRKFATWLLSIAANHCIDLHRRVRPVQVAFDDAPPAQLKDKRSGPEKRAMERELGDKLQGMLNELAPKDRAAMLLYYWYEYSYSEIAEQLKLSEPALKARMHRARRSLAQAWLQSGEAPAFSPRRLYEEATP
jgi:RNA polymerase sigma-70 factor (ECF subfamily)